MSYSTSIDTVEFEILGDNVDTSVVSITTKDIMSHGVPVDGGIYDSHMGTTEPGWNCATCGNPKRLCPGHYGHIKMNYPVQSHMFRALITSWLKITCFKCGKVVIPFTPGTTMSAIATKFRMLSSHVCVHCKTPHPLISRDRTKLVNIIAEYTNPPNTRIVWNHEVLAIFERISDDIVTALKYPLKSHPRNLILRNIRVPANTLRPEIKRMGSSSRPTSNDITVLLRPIVDTNNQIPIILPDVIGDELAILLTNIDLMYYEMLVGSTNGSALRVVTNNNNPVTSLSKRLPGKTGRVRGNIMGKRTGNTARSVISCDPALKIDEVGIPYSVARKIQIEEPVNATNYNQMLIYFNNRNEYPGCSNVVRGDRKYWVASVSPNFKLEIGDVIHRDVINGDVVMFNRPPSLLGSAMTCHKVVVLRDSNTIRMNISVCVIYAADFDGDTMHLYFPTSIVARNEIEIISNVGENLISKKDSNPMIGCFQDNLLSVIQLTREHVRISKRCAIELMKDIPVEITQETYTGRELLSLLIPDINYTTTGKSYNAAFTKFVKYKKSDINVVIKNGLIISGIMDFSACGQENSNTIFQMINDKYGPKKTMDVIYNMQRVVMRYICDTGFTVSSADLRISKASLKDVDHSICKIITESKMLTAQLAAGKLVPPLGLSIREFYEHQQIEILRITDEFLGPVIKDVCKDNGLYTMISMAKKGKFQNFQAMECSIGQQTIDGKRAKMTCGYQRSLPYFNRYDTDPESRGFCIESYVRGQSVLSFIFTAQDARQSVINKALSTSEVGFQNREAVKNFESMIINYYYQTAKNRNVVQLLYGGNGFDIRKMHRLYNPAIALDNTQMQSYKTNVSAFPAKWKSEALTKLLDAEFTTLMKLKSEYLKSVHNWAVCSGTLSSNKINTPVDIETIITDSVLASTSATTKTFNPVEALKYINDECDNLVYVYSNSFARARGSPTPTSHVRALQSVLFMIRTFINAKSMLKHKISNATLVIIFDRILLSVHNALIDYGTPAGIISSQSISEPFTQYIISSHHRSGMAAGADQTDKMTRSKELFLCRSTAAMSAPTMSLHLNPEDEDDIVKATMIANTIEQMQFGRFVSTIAILFEKFGEFNHPDYINDKKWVVDSIVFKQESTRPNLTKWCIRFALNKMEMILKDMDLDTIILILTREFPAAYIIYNTENSDDVCIRVYITEKMAKIKSYGLDTVIKAKTDIMNTIIRGIDGITNALVIPGNRTSIVNGIIKSKPVNKLHIIGANAYGLLQHSGIDHETLFTNSIIEIEQLYGIEAACKLLTIEIEKLIPEMNPTHYSIYADEMCYNGVYLGINKVGLKAREGNNILLRVSYNNVKQTYVKAAAANITSKIYGSSASLMIGDSSKVGTAYSSVSMNHKFITDNVEKISDILLDL